jgi:outer membrane lipoprotein carrier protein
MRLEGDKGRAFSAEVGPRAAMESGLNTRLRQVLFFFILPLLLSFRAPVIQTQPRDILARTEAALASLDSFQADFEQSFSSTTISTPLREKGRLFYQKPGRMRWEYKGASSQIVVLKGGLIETYDPEENQLIRQKIPENQSDTAIFGLFSGQARLTEAYEVENQPFPGAEGPVHQLKLTPKEESETDYLLLEIDARTNLLRRVVLFDWAGNQNEFAFSRLKTNLRLGPDLLTIKVPPDCEIIDDAAPRKR